MEYKQYKSGQKVKNHFGQTLTVILQEGCQVFVEEECLGHYHPNNLSLIDNLPNNLIALSFSNQH